MEYCPTNRRNKRSRNAGNDLGNDPDTSSILSISCWIAGVYAPLVGAASMLVKVGAASVLVN